MNSRSRLTVIAVLAIVVVGGAIGVLTAPGSGSEPVPRLTPGADFTPGYVVVPPVATPAPSATALPTVAPQPEPTASTGSIPTDRLPIVRFTGANSVILPVEVPPASEYGIGLSGRQSLEGRGMLFYYPDGKGTSGFWMKNTHINLDIAFVDASMTVIAVFQMQADTETVHRPNAPYLAAIEAHQGYYAAVGIGVGARVEFLFDVAAATRQ
ncbi:MAG: DUF192 domain-containing protein [Dehalococcoidia bacterium]|nr:MAG: DUF192 domain-containing protein [Dehalococcoidia bacterium]